MSRKSLAIIALLFLLSTALPDHSYAAGERAEIDPRPANPPAFQNTKEVIPYDIMKRWSIRITGSLKNETALRVSNPVDVTKIKNQFILSGTGKVSENIRFKVSGRAWYDAVYDWTHTYPRWVKSDQGTDLELRDTYVDLSYGPFDLRLGKQQIVWGEAVALFYADCVNARDLREFILPDFDMIRIPQWGVDLEYSNGDFHAEFVWLPDVEFDKLGVTNSEFFFYPPIPSPSTLFIYHDAPDVNSSFPNGNVGGRLSYIYNGLDMSAFYYHTWTKDPVYYRTLLNNGQVYNYMPERKRLDIIGATFAKEFNGIVVKGEFVYDCNNYYSVNDASDDDGIVRRNDLNYLIGVDYTFFNRLETNFQFMQKVIFNYTDSLINQVPVDNSVALRLKTEFFDKKFEPEFLAVTSLWKTDFMLRPKAALHIDKNWKWTVGSDIFCGRWNGLFGQFDRKSRIYSDISCNF